MLKSAMAKLLTVKVAAIIAASGAGGVALAASSGVLPNPLTGSKATPSATHVPTKPAPSRPAGADGQASPSPSLVGLCRAYAAGAGANPGKALDNPAFTALITAAGGKDQVDEYCDTLDAKPGATPSHPGSTPNGGRRPTATPSAGGGAPTSRPDTPASKAPGKPAAVSSTPTAQSAG